VASAASEAAEAAAAWVEAEEARVEADPVEVVKPREGRIFSRTGSRMTLSRRSSSIRNGIA
jgi:hypothetical protein